MNRTGMVTESNAGEDVQRTRFVDYLDVLVRWRRFIVLNVLAVSLLAAGVSLLLPKWYKATASLLPPKDQGVLNLFGSPTSMLRGLTSLAKIGGGGGQQSGSYNYFAILKSRAALETVVRKFDLVSVYGVSDSSVEKAVKELKDNVAFEYQDDDYITVDVYDKDPRRAAGMANAFVDILNTMSIELGTREARNNREFIGQRINEARDSLRNSEEMLKKFQERSGMMMTPEQTSSVSAIAELYAMKAKKEVEIAVLQRTVTPDNNMLQQARLELAELDRKFATFPQKGLETFRLYRDVLTQQKILEVLVPLFEQARINEQKDIPVLLVLDKAVPPERKVKPQRSLIVFLAFSLSLFFCVAASFLLHGLSARPLRPAGNAVESRFHAWAGKIAAFYRIGPDV